MKTLAFRSMLLLALLLHQASVSGAQEAKPSVSCNPWSANFRGDVRITSQAEADEYACFRRIIGSLTLVQSSATPIVLPKLHGVIGDLHIVFARTHDHAELEPARVLEQLMPKLENVTGRITLEYRGDALLSGMRDSVLNVVALRTRSAADSVQFTARQHSAPARARSSTLCPQAFCGTQLRSART